MDMNEFIEGIVLGDEQRSAQVLNGIDLQEVQEAGWLPNPVTSEDVLDALNLPVRQATPAPFPWHPRLTFDIAMKEDQQILCDRYSLRLEDLEALYYIAAFRREIADHQKLIREEGVTFRQKAKVQAEMYLEVLDDIVNNADVSAATRLDAIKSVVKWGDLEPKVDKAAQSAMPQFNIQINL